MSWRPRSQKDNKRTPQHYYNEPDEFYNYGYNYNNDHQKYSQESQHRKQYHSQYDHTTYNQQNRNYHKKRYNYNHHNKHNNNRYYNDNNQYQTYGRYNVSNYNQSYGYQHGNNNQKINKNLNNIKYVKNTGLWHIEEIPLNELNSTLQKFWNKYYHKNADIIDKIILLCGPPGSGKTSVSNFVETYYNLNILNTNDYMIDVSTIISDVIKKNNGEIIMYKVYDKLVEEIVQNMNKYKVLIIDGFLRKEQHVFVVKFLMFMMKETAFIFLVIDVDEETAVKRQIERGQRLLKLLNNDTKQKQQQKQQRLKDSDLDPDKAWKRYHKYNRLLEPVRCRLKTETNAVFDVIDGNKSLQNVCQNVQIQLKKQENNRCVK